MARQNDELARQSEELSQQAEELSQQSEELSRQNEELQTQTEEIQTLNAELNRREELLQKLLDAARLSGSEQKVMHDICHAAMGMFGEAAAAVAVYEKQADRLVIQAIAGLGEANEALKWRPAEKTFPSLVIDENRTACLNDATLRPDITMLEVPGQGMCQAVLCALMQTDGRAFGAVSIYSRQKLEWTAEQFRLAEWLAGQCAHILEALRFQDEIRRLYAEQQVIFNSSPAMIWYKDRQNNFIRVNRAVALSVGKSPDEIEGKSAYQLFPQQAERYYQDDLEVINSGQPKLGIVEQMDTADGETRWVLTDKLPYRDETGKITGVLLFTVDITERKRAEEAIREGQRQNEFLASVVERSSQPFAVGYPDGRLGLVNNAFEKLTGYTGDELRAIDWAKTLTPPDWQEIEEQKLEELRRTGQAVRYRKEYIRKDGVRVPIELLVHIAEDSESKPEYYYSFITDITAQKQTEDILHQAKAAAESANEDKGRFLANISHELRTPMNAILGMVDLALQKQTDPTARDFLRTAKESADLLLAILSDLLDSAKIDAGKLELESAAFSLRRVLEQTAQVLIVRASEKGIPFSYHIAPEVPDVFVGDQVRLRQILLNLAGNGIKFTDKGEVAIGIEIVSQTADGACLEFAVRDTGIGIPQSDLEHIFQPFIQADASSTRRFGGTGLGLTICSNLVSMMGGRIWVQSEPGKGSTFCFTVRLPLGKELPPEPKAPQVPTATSKLHILLVEDNPANQKLAAYILQERGHAVDIAGSGLQALDLAQDNHYNVILMDVQMPGMDGLEATKAIREKEREKRVPIVAMTAHAMKGDRERCLAADMDGYLPKPIDGHELIALVETLAAGLPSYAASPGSSAPIIAESVTTTAVFDPELALKRCYNSPDMLSNMIQCFFDEADRLFQQMFAALHNGDLAEFGRLGHRLKGTIVYLGAEQATEAVLGVERFERHGGQPAEAEQAIEILRRECDLLKAVLAGHR